MLTEKEFNKQQENLDNEMSKIWEHPFVDGITEYKLYKDEPIKILWILKEPNGTKGGNHRELHLNVKDYYSRWQNTYANIMYVGYGILEDIKKFSEIPHINKDECLIRDQGVLDRIAIINVNKSGGGSRTPKGKMENEYKRTGVKDFLLKQIEFIAPDIIINSHGVRQFFIDQVGDNEIKKINAEEYSVNNNRLIIWTTHPNGAHQESYCNNILNIVSLWKK